MSGTLVGPGGARIVLGAELARGGEGTVHAVAGSSDVVKLYASAPTPERAAKLEALVAGRPPGLRGVAAWPTSLVRDGSGVRGFAMPRFADAVPLSRVTIPRARKAFVPAATWAWLVHLARNLAIAVESAHRAGVVIGDVNDGNFLVRADAGIRLIDVDSYQVERGGRTFGCDVGMPMFQPPELQGRAFTGLRRTADHDRFGLAVLLFELLFMGRHPWAGTFAGPELRFELGEPIARLPFAWSAGAAAAGFAPPRDALALADLPPAVAELFERAFARDGAGARPSGERWAHALAAFEAELAPCGASATHRTLRGRACPWCAFERGLPPLFFFAPDPRARAAGGIDVAAAERALAELAARAPAPEPVDLAAVPAVVGRSLPPLARAHRAAWWLLFAALGAAIVAVALSPQPSAALGAGLLATLALQAAKPRFARERIRREAALAATDQAHAALVRRWRAANEDVLRAERGALAASAEELASLPGRFASERRALERSRRSSQQRAFLERFTIEDARIAGIGRASKATLRAFGNARAADVDGIAAARMPGLGMLRLVAIAAWQDELKRRFRFDPSAPVDAGALAELAARERGERARLERADASAPRRAAERLAAQARERAVVRGALEPAMRALAQARADVAALRLAAL